MSDSHRRARNHHQSISSWMATNRYNYAQTLEWDIEMAQMYMAGKMYTEYSLLYSLNMALPINLLGSY